MKAGMEDEEADACVMGGCVSQERTDIWAFANFASRRQQASQTETQNLGVKRRRTLQNPYRICVPARSRPGHHPPAWLSGAPLPHGRLEGRSAAAPSTCENTSTAAVIPSTNVLTQITLPHGKRRQRSLLYRKRQTMPYPFLVRVTLRHACCKATALARLRIVLAAASSYAQPRAHTCAAPPAAASAPSRPCSACAAPSSPARSPSAATGSAPAPQSSCTAAWAQKQIEKQDRVHVDGVVRAGSRKSVLSMHAVADP